MKALGASAFSGDPIANLATKGFTLSPALAQQWNAVKGTKPLPSLPHGVTPASFKGAVTFQAPKLPIVPAAPPANGYDATAGLTLAAANLALQAVYQSGTIPHQVALDQLVPQGELNLLAGAFKVDRPGGQISRLHITAPPALNAIADGSSIVALQIPIQIDWVQQRMLATGQQIRKVITDAVGTLQLTVRLVANVVSRPATHSSTMTISVQLVTDVTSAANSPRLTLTPQSPVQLTTPVPANQIDGIAVIIQNALSQQLKNALSFPVSPVLTLPIGTLEIRRVDVVTSGVALVAGIQVVGTQGTANPAGLTNLLPNGTTNIFVQVQEVVANLLMQQSLHNGSLTAAAKAQNDNAVVDSASASFQGNSLVAQVKGRLVDECPLGADLVFITTRTVSFKLEGNTIEIDQSDDNSIADTHNLWCLLTSLGMIGLAVLGGVILEGAALGIGAGILAFILTNVGPFVLDKLIGSLFGGGGDNASFVDLTSPIPGSDFLPTLSGGFFQVAGGAMLVAATAGLQADNINTVIYVRFLVPDGGITVFSSKPLAGATVALMDQDAPAPAGDDAPTTVPHGTSTGHGTHVTTTSFSFQPATSDQKLAEGKTDIDGIVRFALLKDQLTSTGGTIVKKVQRFDVDADKVTTITSKSGEVEPKPDLYFRVTMPDGSVVDTRKMPGGFMVNFTSARVGTLANPLTFSLGGLSSGGVLTA